MRKEFLMDGVIDSLVAQNQEKLVKLDILHAKFKIIVLGRQTEDFLVLFLEFSFKL